MTTTTELRTVRSAAGGTTHRMDVAYAVLGRALCGARVNRAEVSTTTVDCKRCRELS